MISKLNNLVHLSSNYMYLLLKCIKFFNFEIINTASFWNSIITLGKIVALKQILSSQICNAKVYKGGGLEN